MTQAVYQIAFIATLAFIVGFATRRGSICAVIAARQLVVHRRTARTVAFAVAACAAGAVTLPLAWYFPNWATVSSGYPVTKTMLVCGALFGLGAYINNACAFGTLAHLTGGDTDYAGTIVGVVLGALCIPLLDLKMAVSPHATLLAEPQLVSWMVLTVFIAVVAAMLWRYLRSANSRDTEPDNSPSIRPWDPGLAMIFIGLAGGLLHAIAGEWTYMAVLSQRAIELFEARFSSVHWSAIVAIAALIAGGASAAWISGTFALKRIRPFSCLWKIIGGALMGASAALIPGGNDVLLLHGLPSFAPHAIAAYVSMTVVLIVIFSLRKHANQ